MMAAIGCNINSAKYFSFVCTPSRCVSTISIMWKKWSRALRVVRLQRERCLIKREWRHGDGCFHSPVGAMKHRFEARHVGVVALLRYGPEYFVNMIDHMVDGLSSRYVGIVHFVLQSMVGMSSDLDTFLKFYHYILFHWSFGEGDCNVTARNGLKFSKSDVCFRIGATMRLLTHLRLEENWAPLPTTLSWWTWNYDESNVIIERFQAFLREFTSVWRLTWWLAVCRDGNVNDFWTIFLTI